MLERASASRRPGVNVPTSSNPPGETLRENDLAGRHAPSCRLASPSPLSMQSDCDSTTPGRRSVDDPRSADCEPPSVLLPTLGSKSARPRLLAAREWFIVMRPCATTRDARERSQATKPALDILKLPLELRGVSRNELRPGSTSSSRVFACAAGGATETTSRFLTPFCAVAPDTGDGDRPPNVEMVHTPPRPTSFADLRVGGAEVHDTAVRPTDEILSDPHLPAPRLGLKARRVGEAVGRTPPVESCNGDFC